MKFTTLELDDLTFIFKIIQTNRTDSSFFKCQSWFFYLGNLHELLFPGFFILYPILSILNEIIIELLIIINLSIFIHIVCYLSYSSTYIFKFILVFMVWIIFLLLNYTLRLNKLLLLFLNYTLKGILFLFLLNNVRSLWFCNKINDKFNFNP
jgi:hypothetical protein